MRLYQLWPQHNWRSKIGGRCGGAIGVEISTAKAFANRQFEHPSFESVDPFLEHDTQGWQKRTGRLQTFFRRDVGKWLNQRGVCQKKGRVGAIRFGSLWLPCMRCQWLCWAQPKRFLLNGRHFDRNFRIISKALHCRSGVPMESACSSWQNRRRTLRSPAFRRFLRR